MTLSTLVLPLALLGGAAEEAPTRPNLVLILADDLGFSDLRCYGGEIETPRLDKLAHEGLRFTQFYCNAKCETTRAALLSGRYHPEVASGKLADCTTIAEDLRGAGYRTLMAGKWHMAGHPCDRGFDRYFGHLSGATNYFLGDKTFRLDRDVYEVPSEGFYTTEAVTDHAIAFLKDTVAASPFFLYLAYNAPHYPLQAREEDVAEYRGRYLEGWDQLRTDRHRRQLEMGLLPEKWSLSPRPESALDWATLDDAARDREDFKMATYAAMVDVLDRNIGRVVDTLRELRQLDDTLILFLSDNGACPFDRTRGGDLSPWDPASYWCYHEAWANACNTPLRLYKQNQHEGGISTPLIAHWPAGLKDPGRIDRGVGHLFDIKATLRELADLPPAPDRGRSFAPILGGDAPPPETRPLFFQFKKNRAVRDGRWKLVARHQGTWELYDLEADRTELHDLARAQPARVVAMARAWYDWAQDVGIGKKTRAPLENEPTGIHDE